MIDLLARGVSEAEAKEAEYGTMYEARMIYCGALSVNVADHGNRDSKSQMTMTPDARPASAPIAPHTATAKITHSAFENTRWPRSRFAST